MTPAPPPPPSLDWATAPSSFSSGSSSPSGLASSGVGAWAVYAYRPWSTARFRRCSSMTASVSSEYVRLRRLAPSASLGERNARSGAGGVGSVVGGSGKDSAGEDIFPFASRSFAPALSTAVTCTAGGTCDGTGLRRAIAVPPPMPGVVVLTPTTAPVPPVREKELPGGPCARASCDQPAAGVGFLPPTDASMPVEDIVGGDIGEPVAADKPNDVGGVLASLEESSWHDRTARGCGCSKDLFDSMRDWSRASSVEVVYTVYTWRGRRVSVYGDFSQNPTTYYQVHQQKSSLALLS